MNLDLISGFYNIDAETAFLGAILMEPDLIKSARIKPEQLSPGKHQFILNTMYQLDKKSIAIDFVTILNEIGHDQIENIGGISYLSQLAGSVPTTSNFHHYENVIFEHWQKRQVINVLGQLKEDLHNDVNQAIQSAINDLMNLESLTADDDDGTIKQALIEVYDELESSGQDITGIKTGFKELDKMTGGLQEKDFIIIGARPSVGKTAFALNIATNAVETGDVAAVFSLEMPKKNLLKRLIALIGRIDAIKLRNAVKKFSEKDWMNTTHAIAQLAKADLHIFDKATVTVNDIWRKTRKLKRQYKGRRLVVIIDYLQLIMGDARLKGNRTQEIGDISRNLKRMASELGVSVIALSQLSRGVEQRQDKRPMLSDLRESGQIEQDADVIAFLYRDDYYNKDTETKNIIEVILAKQRNGPIGTVNLAFIKEYGVFLNLEIRTK